MEPPSIQTPVPGSAGTNDVSLVADASSNAPESEAWRRELATRLNHYRSRRKAPPPRYPSLQLPFDAGAVAIRQESGSRPLESVADPVFQPDEGLNDRSHPASQKPTSHNAPPPPVSSGAKIIEFPRFAWAPPPPPPDQLAGPVIDVPRILEVPEVAPFAPALGGITIEPARVEEIEKRPGIDIPLQSAPVERRLLASLIDGLIIAAASALFGFVFWKATLVRPPQIQLWSLAAGIPVLFWTAYQYLLIVYAGSTPGLHLAGLQLSRFDGTSARRSLRRWRVLASYLSAASLGMGYAWVFLDEDALCWHDRITHTYLAPRKPERKS